MGVEKAVLVSSKCGLSDVGVWSECHRSVVQASSKCGPRVGQVWKFRRYDDETVKLMSLVAPEELFVRVFRCAAPHRLFGVISVILSISLDMMNLWTNGFERHRTERFYKGTAEFGERRKESTPGT